MGLLVQLGGGTIHGPCGRQLELLKGAEKHKTGFHVIGATRPGGIFGGPSVARAQKALQGQLRARMPHARMPHQGAHATSRHCHPYSSPRGSAECCSALPASTPSWDQPCRGSPARLAMTCMFMAILSASLVGSHWRAGWCLLYAYSSQT